MGLDENLPIFVLASSPDGTKHHDGIYHAMSGDEPELVYLVKHADPALDHSQNCYAAALFDAHNPDILYGEVLLRPEWTQTNLPNDDARRGGGIPPPPEPMMPSEFTIQLYNPDQQVAFVYKSGGLVASPKWEFSIPQDTFRTPSGSILDRTQNDPVAAATTPRVTFAWKRDNKFTNTLTCAMTGKSTDVLNKKKSKEPDITIGVYKSLKELMIYEPNMYRLDIEDLKGLEVILLLSSAVLRDVFYGQMKNPFNIAEMGRRRSSTQSTPELNKVPISPPLPNHTPRYPVSKTSAAVNGLYSHQHPPREKASSVNSQHHQPQPPHGRADSQPPITDPRTQWEIDAETARLKAKVSAESREQKRKEEARKKEQKRLADEETKRLKKIVEAEEKERLKKQKEVEKETERLRKKYGNQQPSLPPRPQPQYQEQHRPMMTPAVGPQATQYQNRPPQPQQYQQPQIVLPPQGYHYNPQIPQQIPPHFMPPPQNNTALQQPQPQPGKRKSFLDLRNFTSLGNRSGEGASISRPNSAW